MCPGGISCFFFLLQPQTRIIEFALLFTVSINTAGNARPLWWVLLFGSIEGTFSRIYPITKIFDSCSLKTFLVECNCNANTGAIVQLLVTTQGSSANQVAATRCSWVQSSFSSESERDLECGTAVGGGRARLFQELLISWGSHTRSPLRFTENVPKRREKSAVRTKSAPLMGGRRRMVPDGTSEHTWNHEDHSGRGSAGSQQERGAPIHTLVGNREEKAGVTSLHFRSGIFRWSFLAGQWSMSQSSCPLKPVPGTE